uniref:Uncharacterized protein n=1 Tax=Arundo donax TaxID=35708 RepID=A0A0A8YDV0_ARUDO
MASLPAASAS